MGSPFAPFKQPMSPLRRTIRRRVRRGSRFLEEHAHVPEVYAYRQRILDHIEATGRPLNLADGTHCVLGKLFPRGYGEGVDVLGLVPWPPGRHEHRRDADRTVSHGFLAPYELRYERPETELNQYYSILTEEWMNEILLT